MAQIFGSQHIKRKQEDSRNGISNIPTNKTIYINQFTAKAPTKPNLVKGLKKLNQIFKYYTPTNEIIIEDYLGAFINEIFVYKELKDFNPENILKSSNVLLQLKQQQLECLELLKAAKKNIGFQEIIQKKTKRNNFIATLNSFKEHLDTNNEIKFIKKSLNNKNAALNVLLSNDHEWYRIIKAQETNSKDSIFLKALKTKLQAQHYLWYYLFSDIQNITEFVRKGESYYKELDLRIKKNLHTILEASKPLESAYYALDSFLKNTNTTEVNNLTLLNADIEECKALDNPIFLNTVKEEFTDNYDRLDLMEHYSLMVIPGYLGSHTTLEQWAKIASDNKVLLITDFRHLDTPDDVVELFEKANHVRADLPMANTIMTCNWLVARGANRDLGETEPLYIAPSSALAGKLYSSLLSQACAGTQFGTIDAARGVRFLMTKNDLSVIEQKGLIPMYYANGSTIAYSAKTLFNGNNLGLQTYSVVRVFDYLSKVLVDYLNQRTFENFNINVRKQAMEEIIQFLDKHVGANKLISNFSVLKFERDPKKKDQVILNLNITPYFPAKNFLIRMYGKNNALNSNWNTNYEVA
ncbi:type VI secretion system contractile sheath protein TssC [uncultured Maribacter sp.]|uniref:type VI secretion system contractile sheath protein TssC n=1 Tax=uncultured Maribacter sp. TaxID=431308 RepID=UPI00260655EE|nr:type VI secretion system contractile sheath protein TssC [uncultured Maribacter sp.]